MGLQPSIFREGLPGFLHILGNTNVIQGHQLQRQVAEKLLVLPDFSLIVGSDQQFG